MFLDRDPKDSILTHVPIYAEALYPSICASNDNFIVSGGCSVSTGRSISKVQKFSLIDTRWVDLPDLPDRVYSHGSTYAAGKLYTIGGANKENHETLVRCHSINILDLASLSWTYWPYGLYLPIAVTLPGIATVDQNIYVLGGYDGK